MEELTGLPRIAVGKGPNPRSERANRSFKNIISI